MDYKNGIEVLPAQLLKEIQKHFNGGLIYIPKEGDKTGWGQLSGTKKELKLRNDKMLKMYKMGDSVTKIAEDFYLSPETVKKIVYGKNA